MQGQRGRPKKEESGICFFGAVDRDDKGKIKSATPAWYKDTCIEDLERQQESLELQMKWVDAEGKLRLGEQMKNIKERVDAIKASRPRLNAVQKDRVAKFYTEGGAEAKAAHFKASDMEKGLISPRDELRNQTEPILSCPDPELVTAAGGKVVKGKCSRNDLVAAWKYCGRLLGEPTHSGHLQRD